MASRAQSVVVAAIAYALLLAATSARASDEEKCRAKGWDYSHTEVKGDERIVHCKKATTRIFVGTYDKVATTVIENVKPQYMSNLISKHP